MFFLIFFCSFVCAAEISASPSEENMCYFNGMILGPSQSPYEDDNLILVGFLLFLLSDSFEV
ncbi:Ubiquitin-conjugating enzyme E2 36 [Platanthera guangdongensis]|uniref:Ubiquitin-conjugating enzyme E2 36 n=1 Tax=Platanthera guangdongensis TaxID=2320717 RepID=A0ABR2MQD7_9ASPA